MPVIVNESIEILARAGLGMAMFGLGERGGAPFASAVGLFRSWLFSHNLHRPDMPRHALTRVP